MVHDVLLAIKEAENIEVKINNMNILTLTMKFFFHLHIMKTPQEVFYDM